MIKNVFKKTISSIFILPTLNINRVFLLNHGFINAYIKDIDKLEYENVFMLLFKPKNLSLFREFVDDLYENFNLIEDYDYDNYVVLVFPLDEKFKSDYKLICLGQYSKLSEEFKNLFPKKILDLNSKSNTKVESIQHLIFNKDKRLLNFWKKELEVVSLNDSDEVWFEFNQEKETLNINKILKNE
jgi:hypothetical protein